MITQVDAVADRGQYYTVLGLYGGCRQTKLVTWLRLDTTKVYVAFFLVTFLSALYVVALIIAPFIYKGNTSLLFSVVFA